MSFSILFSGDNKKVKSAACSLRLLIPGVVMFAASLANASITYSQDTNIHDFSSTVSKYATFMSNNFTPTSAEIEGNNPIRVVGSDVTVDFGAGNQVSQIVVFNNIDHIGYAWDAFQPYRISGSNDNITFTQFTDAFSATPADVPGVDQHFELTSYNGPFVWINNTISNNHLGYETYLDFSSFGSFRYYKFSYSTLTHDHINSGEWEVELSGVGAGVAPAPEPGSLLLVGSGLTGLGGLLRRRFCT